MPGVPPVTAESWKKQAQQHSIDDLLQQQQQQQHLSDNTTTASSNNPTPTHTMNSTTHSGGGGGGGHPWSDSSTTTSGSTSTMSALTTTSTTAANLSTAPPQPCGGQGQGRRRKKRHKLSIAKLCSCMVAEPAPPSEDPLLQQHHHRFQKRDKQQQQQQQQQQQWGGRDRGEDVPVTPPSTPTSLLKPQASIGSQHGKVNTTDSLEAPSPHGGDLPIVPQVARGVHAAGGVKGPASGQQDGALEPPVEEEEPLHDIEMPPPMEIQDHTFKADTKDVSTDDVTAQLASQLSLKPQDGTTSADLAHQIENIVKQRIDPNLDLAGGMGQGLVKPDTSTGLEQEDGVASGKEEEEDKADDGKDAETQKAEAIRKRQFVVQELYDTEKDYVKDLATIVNGYIEYMKENPLPGETEGKDKIVFGNIHQIYDWHNETMLAELEKCLTNPGRVGSIFIRYERRLHMYVKYCENKPKSEYVVSEHLDTYFEEVRQKLGHRLMLPDLLIKPVQRIMRYQLLLKDILKYTERAKEDPTDLKKALRVMCVVPKAANDMMQVGRLQGFDGKITSQGNLLLQDTLLVSEVSSGSQQKPKERRVFLFEQIVIFSEIEGKKGAFSNATYVFKNSLKV
ncbi:hypothetical protein EGW08_009896, partial [Elysia chlorotica]